MFSNFVEGHGLIFYIKENDRFSLNGNSLDNLTYIFRYYPLIDSGICSHYSSAEFQEGKDYFPKDLFFKSFSENISVNKKFFQEITINNSSIINFIDFEENFIIYTKLYDSAVFRSLKKNFDGWEEDFANKNYGEFAKRLHQQTIGLKIIRKIPNRESLVLAIYAMFFFLFIYTHLILFY